MTAVTDRHTRVPPPVLGVGTHDKGGHDEPDRPDHGGAGGVPDDVWDASAKIWSDRELVDLLMAISVINTWNRLGVATRTRPSTA